MQIGNSNLSFGVILTWPKGERLGTGCSLKGFNIAAQVKTALPRGKATWDATSNGDPILYTNSDKTKYEEEGIVTSQDEAKAQQVPPSLSAEEIIKTYLS